MKKHFLIILSIFVFATCTEDWLDEVEPSTSLTPDMAFQTLDDAEVALRGVYSWLWTRTNNQTYWGGDIQTYGDVKGDDVRTSEPGKRTASQYRYTETPESSTLGFWRIPYKGLLNANALLENIEDVEVVTEADEEQRDQIKAQAYTLRAVFHHDLARIYGRMPANGDPSTDLAGTLAIEVVPPHENRERSTVQELYEQTIEDLKTAIPMLDDTRLTNGFINKWAAKGLLSRVLLYYEEYEEALEYAEKVINSGIYELLDYEEYEASWQEEFASEGIWEINWNTAQNADREGLGYLWDTRGYQAVRLTESFIDLLGENEDDIRNSIVDPENGFLGKYVGPEGELSRLTNIRVVRLAEVYLNAAEAAYKTGNQALADGYITAIYDARTSENNTVENVDLDRILLERRKELVGEGHRFFDLMRNGLPVIREGDDHFTLTMELQPDDHRAIQPIPQVEINANPNMVQNPGYGGN